MESFRPIVNPFAKARVSEALQHFERRLAQNGTVYQSQRTCHRAVPDRPAETILDSFVARIDGDDDAQSAPPEMELWVRCLESKSAMMLQRNYVLMAHPLCLSKENPRIWNSRFSPSSSLAFGATWPCRTSFFRIAFSSPPMSNVGGRIVAVSLAGCQM